MQTTLSRAAAAFAALELLGASRNKWSIPVGIKLVRLKQKLQPERDILAELERTAIEEFAQRNEAGEIIWSNGRSFAVRKGCEEACRQRMEAIRNTVIDLDVEPVNIVGQNVQLGLAELEALQDFLIMEEA